MQLQHDDVTLVLGARAGDPEAFGLLVRRHLRVAHAVARAVVRDPADADDVVQDGFIEALRCLEQCRDPARFRGWLLTIVRTRGLNLRRRIKVRQTEPLETARGIPGGSDPGRELDRVELRDELNRALARLGDREREVLLLSDLEGWPHSEVAELLGIGEAASRQHLHRARRRMRSILTGIQEDRDDR